MVSFTALVIGYCMFVGQQTLLVQTDCRSMTFESLLVSFNVVENRGEGVFRSNKIGLPCAKVIAP
jgi:hypothetical protein